MDGTQQPELSMPSWSKYAGQPVDTTSRRSIVIQTSGETLQLIEPTAKRATVDFFYHCGQFWRAVIPLNAVQDVFGQAFNFSPVRTHRRKGELEIVVDRFGIPKHRIPMLNHVQVRFTLAPDYPIKLFPLSSDASGEPVHVVTDFVHSLEVLGPAGSTFNLRDGLAGNFLSAHRFLSTQEMVFERLVVGNEFVTESPPLPLTAINKRQLLAEALLRSHLAGLHEAYYLYRPCRTNNCTSSPFTILDDVVDYGWRRRLGAIFYRLPFSPRFYLRVRGLDADPSQRKLVREEFTDYIEDPATQARKREYVRSMRAARNGGLR
jgi:hypothetical protein